MLEETMETTVTAGPDDWDDIEIGDEPSENVGDETVEAAEDLTEDTASEADKADQPEQPEDEADVDDDEDKDDKETDQFTLKHLNETKTVSRDEVITLAQKGMDYDRIRQRMDEQSAAYSALQADTAQTSSKLRILDEIASQSGFADVDELLEDVQADMLADEVGVDKSVALQKIRLDRYENELRAREERLVNERAVSAQRQAEESRKQDFREFLQSEYVTDPHKIPQEVWDIYNKGGRSLVQAFAAYDNTRLKAENEALKRNADNRGRSTGSRKSVGRTPGKDKDDDLWYNGE